MKLKYNLSEKVNERLNELSANKIYYAVPYDIDDDGQLIKDGMCVVTDKNICVFKGDECIRTYTVSDCSNTVSEVGVGVGMLVTQLDGRQQRILRYSSKHRTRFAYIARGINILSSGCGRYETLQFLQGIRRIRCHPLG